MENAITILSYDTLLHFIHYYIHSFRFAQAQHVMKMFPWAHFFFIILLVGNSVYYKSRGGESVSYTHLDVYKRQVLDERNYQFLRRLQKEGFITLKSLFSDGTKIEANANRYTFVWRDVYKRQMHLRVKQCCVITTDFTWRILLCTKNI